MPLSLEQETLFLAIAEKIIDEKIDSYDPTVSGGEVFIDKFGSYCSHMTD